MVGVRHTPSLVPGETLPRLQTPAVLLGLHPAAVKLLPKPNKNIY